MSRLDLSLDYSNIEYICNNCFDERGSNKNFYIEVIDNSTIDILKNLDNYEIYIKHVRLRSPLKIEVKTDGSSVYIKVLNKYLIRYSGTIDLY